MGPKTGPRPASSTPSAHGGPGIFEAASESSLVNDDVRRRLGGTGEKCV
jgi:hypothetical protein